MPGTVCLPERIAGSHRRSPSRTVVTWMQALACACGIGFEIFDRGYTRPDVSIWHLSAFCVFGVVGVWTLSPRGPSVQAG